MSKTFRQYDSRWGSHAYPTGSDCTMADSGCGPTACADIIVNHPKHTSKNPVNTKRYMIKNGYAVAGHGTAWDGIDACLKYYGFKVKRCDDMETFWAEMKKDKRWAIVLFGSGTRGGVKWTSSGHFLAATSYKVKDGKHWLYMRDPGQRNNDGWFCYEDHMKGLIKLLWVAWLPSDVTTPKKYTGTFPTLPSKGYLTKGDKGRQVKHLQKFLNWCILLDLDVDGDLGILTMSGIETFQAKYDLAVDGKFGKLSLAKAKTVKK